MLEQNSKTNSRSRVLFKGNETNQTPSFLLYCVSLIPSPTFTSSDFGEKSIGFKFSLIPNFSMQKKNPRKQEGQLAAVQLASEFSVICAKLRDSRERLIWSIRKIQNTTLMSTTKCH